MSDGPYLFDVSLVALAHAGSPVSGPALQYVRQGPPATSTGSRVTATVDFRRPREWHYSLNSIFFHEVDELDTSKAAVICTTNRDDLVDAAIRDRFYEITFLGEHSDTETPYERAVTDGGWR